MKEVYQSNVKMSLPSLLSRAGGIIKLGKVWQVTVLQVLRKLSIVTVGPGGSNYLSRLGDQSTQPTGIRALYSSEGEGEGKDKDSFVENNDYLGNIWEG